MKYELRKQVCDRCGAKAKSMACHRGKKHRKCEKKGRWRDV